MTSLYCHVTLLTFPLVKGAFIIELSQISSFFLFLVAFWFCHLPFLFGTFCWCKGFCYRIESELFLTPITELREVFMKHLRRVWHVIREHYPLRRPDPSHFRTCISSNNEISLYRSRFSGFSLLISLVTFSILLTDGWTTDGRMMVPDNKCTKTLTLAQATVLKYQ